MKYWPRNKPKIFELIRVMRLHEITFTFANVVGYSIWAWQKSELSSAVHLKYSNPVLKIQ